MQKIVKLDKRPASKSTWAGIKMQLVLVVLVLVVQVRRLKSL